MGLQSSEWAIADQLPEPSGADCSTARALTVPSMICAAMIVVAAVTSELASLDVRQLFAPYLSSAAAISLLAVLLFVFLEFGKLARVRAADPFAIVKAKLIARAPLMVLPALVLPLFLIGYTASKTAIPFLVGYAWDPLFANADRLIFGDDVWRISGRMLGYAHVRVWEWFYTVGWVAVFFAAANGVALLGSKRFVGVFFSAMLGSWLIGGCLLAYSFSAAGPVFAGLFHPQLVHRFAPMHHALEVSLGSGPINFTQHYLAKTLVLHVSLKGGGISAMPSMHLAAASTCVLAARRTSWLPSAVLFWLIIFVASGYFGYHYWVDGIAAAVLAAAMWNLSEAAFAPKSSIRDELGQGHVPSLANQLNLAQKAR